MERSIPPGTTPPTLRNTRLTARPMVALARLPCPSAFSPEFMPMRLAMGPLTMITGVENQVVAISPCRVNFGTNAASKAPSTTGRYSGRQPAITALIATFSTVQSTRFGGIFPITSCHGRKVPPSMRKMRSSVGGTTGKPSLQPRSYATSMGSSFSESGTCRDWKGTSPKRTCNRFAIPGSTESEPHPGCNSGSSSPSPAIPVSSHHSLRCQPTVRSTSCPFSRRMRVGTDSISSRKDCSKSRSSTTVASPSGKLGSS